MLDLVEYLTDSQVEKLDISGLQNGLVESKRKGFYEFYGIITGNAGRCKPFSFSCMDSALPFHIEIVTESAYYLIDEVHDQILVSSVGQDWVWKEREFLHVDQSQMTGRVVKSVLDNGSCHLATFDESMELHLKFIRALLPFFKENGVEENICPIT